MTRSLVLAVAALAASSLSCSLLKRDSTAKARIPKPTKTVMLPPPEREAPAPVYIPPPVLEASEPELAGCTPIEPPKMPVYRARRQPRNVARTKETLAEPEPEAAETPVASLPPLEQILTPEQRVEYNRVIDSNLGRALRIVDLLNSRRLNSEQAMYRDRIKEFIQQAEEARKSDLERAKSLAERAFVLAEDVAKSIQ